jgi:hypothetical protein
MKKFLIGLVVLLVLGAVLGQPSSPSQGSQIPMQILAKVQEGRIIRMSVVVPDSVEKSEANLRNVGERIASVTREGDVTHVFVDIFTNVNAFKVRQRIMKDESNTAADKADYYQHFLATYTRNSTNGYHGISVLNRTTLPDKILLGR